MLAEESYVAVVGAVNVDISGTSDTVLVQGDSNPGRVTVTLGGVGRNIAENLRRLGYPVTLVTALGEDGHAERLRQSCRELAMDLSHSLAVPHGRTSTYLCLNDFNGEIAAAVSDMAIYERLTPDFLKTKLNMLNRAALVVLDANLPRESVDYLAQNCKTPLFADPVSVKKAGRLRGALARLVALKPNRAEASLLTGVEIRDLADLPRAAEAFFALGLPNALISLGAQGVYFNDGRDAGILPCYPCAIRNTTGCGDAFIAAAAAGYLRGWSLRNMARLGLAASSLCAQAHSAVNPEMSMEALERILGGLPRERT